MGCRGPFQHRVEGTIRNRWADDNRVRGRFGILLLQVGASGRVSGWPCGVAMQGGSEKRMNSERSANGIAHAIDPASLAALPHRCGVYFFRGEGALPLYIGKSLDLRARVLSHLRAADEARMIAQTRRIDYIETAGEIGALLLESRLIKEQSPIFNQRLRRVRALCSISLQTSVNGLVPTIVDGRSVGLGVTPGLFGLYSSRHAAQAKLRELADAHQLCLGLLGLEKIARRGCFAWQLRRCLGACVGQEQRASHDARLLAGLNDLQIQVWPFAGAVDLIEESGDWTQRHRIDRWCYLGTQCSRGTAPAPLRRPAAAFDFDSYKILVKPILLGVLKIVAVEGHELAARDPVYQGID